MPRNSDEPIEWPYEQQPTLEELLERLELSETYEEEEEDD